MAEVMHGLVSEARKNRFSAIPKLDEEGMVELEVNLYRRSQFHLVCCLASSACIALTSSVLRALKLEMRFRYRKRVEQCFEVYRKANGASKGK